MPSNPARHHLGETCPSCNAVHLTRFDNPACVGHVEYDRESYVQGQDRKRLDQPRACGNAPMRGQSVCIVHGGRNPAAKVAGQKRDAEQKARAAVMRKLGDSGEPVKDPIGTLCSLAGRAVAFMEGLAARVDQLKDDADAEQTRADIVVYGRSIKDAAAIVESIIRMGIAERLAKAEAEQTAAIIAFFDAVLTDLGHNPRDPEVAGVIAARLELVA